ncbi:MAG: hypothetical protein LQ346_003209 [Caloplaca aetnensis]|nr:MAG: hypothetical protein LQ346_003209 [Caloplaca aetnensis]
MLVVDSRFKAINAKIDAIQATVEKQAGEWEKMGKEWKETETKWEKISASVEWLVKEQKITNRTRRNTFDQLTRCSGA